MQLSRKVTTGILVILGILFGGFLFAGIYFTNAEQRIVLNEVCSSNFSTDFHGAISDYVELYNPSFVPVSLHGYSLTDKEKDKEKFVFGDITMKGKSYLVIKMNGENESEDIENLQAPFHISKRGDSLYLYDSKQTLLDSVNLPGLDYDTSYARVQDGKGEWTRSFCSPLASNVKEEKEAAVTFSEPSGFYEEPFELQLHLGKKQPKGTQIYFTLDGSIPDETSELYEEPFFIEDRSELEDIYSDNPDMTEYWDSVFEAKSDKATIVRAVSIDSEGKKSDIYSAVYFVGYQDKKGYTNIPVISIVAEPEDLFGEDGGIYVLGEAYKSGVEGAMPNYANKGKEWEREATFTFFDENHEMRFKQQCGLRIQGASKRGMSQKSMTVNMRYKYGEPYLRENIFGQETLVSKFSMKGALRYIPRDGFPYELVKERHIGAADYMYSAVFINGEYWGLYVVGERFTGAYFEEHYGIDRDNIALLKQSVLEEGTPEDEEDYHDMLNFAQSNDLAEDGNYKALCERMDMQSFIDYFCTQMYICNMDFAEWHNNYIWKSREIGDGIFEDGKWRWLLYDVDYSAGVDSLTTPATDPFRGNMPYSDFTAAQDRLFAALMANPTFRMQFVTTFMDLANTCFETNQTVAKVEEYASLLAEPMQHSMERFAFEGFTEELMNFDSMREFYANRFPYVTGYLADVFGLQGCLAPVQIISSLPEGGEVQINTVCLDFTQEDSWEGQYYTDYPITVTAIPKAGYRFAGWSGDAASEEESMMLSLPKEGCLLIAEFEKLE